MTARLFGHGDFRLWLLKLLEDEPHHGYELIRLLEEQLGGVYAPSAGSVYPRLQALEEAGLIERVQAEGRKEYRITDAGRRELAERFDELRELGRRIADAARLAHDIRDEVRSSIRDLRRELRASAIIEREDAREAARGAREHALREARRAREEARRREPARGPSEEVQRELRSLREDLEAFVSDLVVIARQRGITRARLVRLRALLREARDRAVEALSEEPPPQAD